MFLSNFVLFGFIFFSFFLNLFLCFFFSFFFIFICFLLFLSSVFIFLFFYCFYLHLSSLFLFFNYLFSLDFIFFYFSTFYFHLPSSFSSFLPFRLYLSPQFSFFSFLPFAFIFLFPYVSLVSLTATYPRSYGRAHARLVPESEHNSSVTVVRAFGLDGRTRGLDGSAYNSIHLVYARERASELQRRRDVYDTSLISKPFLNASSMYMDRSHKHI